VQPSASAAPGNLGDVSFAVVNNSSATVYHSIATYCYSGVPRSWWQLFPIAPGQNLSYAVGNVSSGSCIGQVSNGTIWIQGSTSQGDKTLSVKFINQLTVSGMLNVTTSGSSPCMSIFNPTNEIWLGISITIPPPGIASC
jgi:hypothetical protein